MNLRDLTALQLAQKLQKREVGVVEVTADLLGAIKGAKNLNIAVTVCEKEALAQAEQVQKRLDAGEIHSPLAGVPMAVKDNICTRDINTTCGSKMLENFKPPYNATVMNKLCEADTILCAKMNMDEFAMGSTTETSYFGQVKNPWNTNHVPGGSSGGSAATVAARAAYFTLGSDTGGSIRQPASFCGVTGIKPTYGRVSRYGLIAYASSLDQIGPIARTAEDAAAVLDIISGYDRADSTSLNQPAGGFLAALKGDIKGLKVGIPREYFAQGLDEEVKASVLAAAKQLESMGAQVEEFSLPMTKYAIPTYYIIASAEASSNLSRYDGIKYGYRHEKPEDLIDLYLKSRSEGFGREVKRRIMLGAFALSSGYYDAYYKKALQAKALIKKAFDDAFEKYDIILSPTAPTAALKLGESLDDPLKMYLGDIYTVSVNLAGLPALVAPCGFTQSGLPIGVQLIGKPLEEAALLNTAHAYQQATDFHKKAPLSVEVMK